ncbi:MAG: N-acetyltransferase [Tissierellia bacterium]|nr:N-acetyltransferase [Tissierellia bacterium]
MLNIVFEKDNKRAAAYDDGKLIGECTYSQGSDFWIIDHTEVSEDYGGQGIARKLVDKVVEAAREKGLKIIPLCPYAKKVFTENSEYADVWKK